MADVKELIGWKVKCLQTTKNRNQLPTTPLSALLRVLVLNYTGLNMTLVIQLIAAQEQIRALLHMMYKAMKKLIFNIPIFQKKILATILSHSR